MSKLSKPFRLATEGATCDGRTISRQDIVDMAATYAPATYTANTNLEHIRGYSPETPFCAYGDVVALSTEDVTLKIGGKDVTRLALMGQVNATDELIALNSKKQKLYPSIEINPNFAASGKAYLQGLAFTDSPASLGTEIMSFAAGQGDANPFNARKLAPTNFFSAATDAVTLEYVETPAPSAETSAFAAITSFFTNLAKGGATADPVVTPPAPTPPATPTPLPANDNMSAAITQMGKLAEGVANLSAQIDTIASRLAAVEGLQARFSNQLDTTDARGQRRPPADGRGNYAKSAF